MCECRVPINPFRSEDAPATFNELKSAHLSSSRPVSTQNVNAARHAEVYHMVEL